MITLDNFTDTQKLIFADAFETMTCGNLTLDRQYTTEEEKNSTVKVALVNVALYILTANM